jgi:hypothetical protein
MEGDIPPDVFTFNFFSVDRTLNAFKHKENAKLPEDVRLSNLVRYQARQAMNDYENTLLAKSKGYDVWLDDKEAYDWQQRTLRDCQWVVPLPKFKQAFADPKKRRCYTPTSKAFDLLSDWRKLGEENTNAIARLNFEIWLTREKRRRLGLEDKKNKPPRRYYDDDDYDGQAQPLFTLSDLDIDDKLRCDEEDLPIVIPDSPLPAAIAEDGGNKWMEEEEEDSCGDLFIPCAQRTPVPILIEDISDAETESIGRGDPEEPLDEGFDEVEDDQLAVWTATTEKRERFKTILRRLEGSIGACEKQCKTENWRETRTKARLRGLRAAWSTRKRKYDGLCDELDATERRMDEYREQKAAAKRMKLVGELADLERYDYDPAKESRAAFDLCLLLSPKND